MGIPPHIFIFFIDLQIYLFFMALITHIHKEGICKRLLGYDKDIVEIIQFGSSVYAPEYALDVDLL